MRTWHGKHFFHKGTGGPSLCVSKAAIQGREQNVKKWDLPRGKRVRNPMLKPIILWDSAKDYTPP